MIYEQPLNETMRFCLRLENLFQRINLHLHSEEPWQSAFALESLLEILSVIERPDLKSKLSQLLSLAIRFLLDLKAHPSKTAYIREKISIDESIDYLQSFLGDLQNQPGRVGDDLYHNAFIKLVRSQLSIPGGSCPFNAPEYYLWLQQPSQQRIADLTRWLSSLNRLQALVQWLLAIVRRLDASIPVVGRKGFYQQELEAQKAGQIMRVILVDEARFYPVFTVGQHRLAIHFYEPCFNKGGFSTKWEDNVEFNLAYCAF